MLRQTSADMASTLRFNRLKLLRAIGEAQDITFIRSIGNLGDELIFAGIRQLLAHLPYKEVGVDNVESVYGHTAVVAGGGDWCQTCHHALPPAMPKIEERFERVIILPSSFDTSNDIVRDTLSRTKALVFAREHVSYELIRSLCRADIAYDCAFFFDYRPYARRGSGILRAYRTDDEALSHVTPDGSNDISQTCTSLDEWLWAIARCELIETDRAHVMIAAAMLGKHVLYQSSNYHKVPAIATYSLSGFPVRAGTK